MVVRYVKIIEEYLRKVISIHQRDCDERLPIFLLAYRALNHETNGVTPSSMLFGRDLCVPCDVMLGAPPYKEQ